MHNTHPRKNQAITWKHFGGHGYCAFASLKRVIHIGVLSVATLGAATLAQASQQKAQMHIQQEDGEHEESLDEVTVTGTLAPLTALQSARIVMVLGREDIERAEAQSVNDLLKSATGVDVRQRGGFGVQTDISIDGGTFDQMTILLNGVNISNPHTGHLAADFPVSISDIERIEVLEGAASRVYGATAFGGAINIVTRRDKKSSASLALRGGSFGTGEGEARATLTRGHTANRLSGGGGRSDGGTRNSDWRKGQLYYQGDFAHRDFDLDWQFGFSRKAYGANTFYSAAYPNQWEQNERYLISASAETKGRFHFKPKVYWNRTYDHFQLVRGERYGENFHQTDVYGAQLGGHFNWRGGRTAVCSELRQEGILSTGLGHDLDASEFVRVHGKKGIHYTRKDDRTNVSFSLEHNILLARWTLSAGLMTHMSTITGHRFRFYPGADVAYRPAENWKVFLSYNKGFRLPTFTDLYYQSPTHNGNAGLRAEENHSTQVGVQYRRAGIEGTLRGFLHKGHRMIDWVMYNATDTYHSANFNLDNMGAQAEVKLGFPQLLRREIFLRQLTLGYTFMHQIRHDHTPVFKSNYAMEYLRHKFVASLDHRIWRNLSAHWNVRWQDRMGSYIRFDGTYTDPSTGFLRGQSTGMLVGYKPYATLDAKIQWTKPRWQAFVQGTNLTNRRYYDLGNIPQPGICIMAGLQVELR